MYCPSCGDQSTKGLRYCKRCGTGLDGPAGNSSKPFPTALTAMFLFVIAAITIIGLAGPLAAREGILRSFSTHDIMAILFGGWIVTLLIDAMLVWLLLRLIRASQPAGTSQRERFLPEHTIHAQMEPQREPMVSVTENTTRSFPPREYDVSK